MHLTTLTVRDFRNYERLDLALTPGVTLFYGPNAAGKTSVLEAAYLLATTRSPRAGADRELVRFDAQGDIGVAPFARLTGDVQRSDGTVKIELVIQRRADDERVPTSGAAIKTVRVDRKAVRAIDLIGQLRVVLFTPADLILVTGAPAERRRYLDVTLSQVSSRYVRTLSHYVKVVQQRNSLLRGWREQRRPQRGAEDELAFWDRELTMSGAYLLAERTAAIRAINELLGPTFCEITNGTIPLTAVYQSSVPGLDVQPAERDAEHAFRSHLGRIRDDEIGRGMTLVGPHRDDLLLTMGDVPVGVYGSRGQQRAATLALKLAEADYMRARTGEAPVLLLDDLLSELDSERRAHLLRVVARPEQQTLMTSTSLAEFDAELISSARKFRVEQARLYPA